MIILRRPQTDPFFNLAAEEYLLKTKDADYFMLWVNEPAVIVGKHQNTLAEVNFHYLRERNIPVIRRISGGGTVFHDAGNLNFSFIQKGEPGKLVDFKKFIDPIIDLLQSLGINAVFEGKNNIRINNFKISGNSEHVYKNKVLHHGTLLFSSQLDWLEEAIRLPVGEFEDKSVKSIRTAVANISDFLKQQMSIDEFRETIIRHISEKYEDVEIDNFTTSDLEAINKLAEEKYKTWDWNFGYSPAYHFKNSIFIKKEEISLALSVKNGKIEKAEFEFPGKNEAFSKFINGLLSGQNHNFFELQELLNKYRDTLNKWKLNPAILLEILF